MSTACHISAIIPTIGRAASLERLLRSLALQSRRPDEVIIADGSDTADIECIVRNAEWAEAGLNLRRVVVAPPNAVRQRMAAIRESHGDYLLLLDDDVALEPKCLEELLNVAMGNQEVVAVLADFNNQTWAGPTRAWRIYLRYFHGLRDGQWQGRVIGPLLRYGFTQKPARPVSIEWLGAGMSLIRRTAFEQVGGFSDFFLHRCTMNEDVDLGLKLRRVGRILFCPTARLGHFHAPGGRVPQMEAAEDDLYNRYLVMRRTQGRSRCSALRLVLLFGTIETTSNCLGALRRLDGKGLIARTRGRLRALRRIVIDAILGRSRY